MNLITVNDYYFKRKDNHQMGNFNTRKSLFIICPFCQLENFLRAKLEINIHKLITNKHESINHKFKLN